MNCPKKKKKKKKKKAKGRSKLKPTITAPQKDKIQTPDLELIFNRKSLSRRMSS